MADSQVPWGVNALNGTISEPAWKAKPSWYLLTIEDKMIPPDAQRQMAKRVGAMIVEVKGSHSIYVSQPQAVATLIEKAAKARCLLQHANAWRVRRTISALETTRRTKILLRGMNTRLSEKDNNPTVPPPPLPH